MHPLSHLLTPLVLISPPCLLFPSLLNPLQYRFPILVHLQLRNHHFAGMYPDLHALPVCLLAHDPLDVHHVFESVDGGDGAFAAFVRATYDGDFVVFADGDGADLGVVLAFTQKRAEFSAVMWMYRAYFVRFTEFFVQRGGHDDSADAGWGTEVRFARLSP